MEKTVQAEPPSLTAFAALTATDLMTSNPVSIPERALVGEVIALLTDRGFSAAPVIDDAGHPVGVVSRTDIVIHDRHKVGGWDAAADYYDHERVPRHHEEEVPEGFHVEDVDRTTVREIMTPVVFCVAPDASAGEVVEQMLGLNVHRLFVVDGQGVLLGVISALDILRHLSV
jgi:CBS domain-containing protein